MYWGQFGKVKVSGGAFDGTSADRRRHADRRGPRPGRFLGSGRRLLPERHLLRRQEPARHRRRRPGAGRATSTAYSVDFLLERKVGTRRRLHGREPSGRSTTGSAATTRATAPTTAATCWASYLFPAAGRARAGSRCSASSRKARFREGLTALDADYDQKTTEINLNYVIKQFNARVMIFYKDTRFDAVQPDFKQFGVGLQVQM